MSYLIDKRVLYKQTSEWEAQALAMVEKTMHDEDPTEWRRWSAVLTERTAFKHDIADAPTVDAVPVVHGRWIDEGQYGDNFPHHAWRCSECGEHVIEIDTSWYKYCPNCGARMDKE